MHQLNLLALNKFPKLPQNRLTFIIKHFNAIDLFELETFMLAYQ